MLTPRYLAIFASGAHLRQARDNLAAVDLFLRLDSADHLSRAITDAITSAHADLNMLIDHIHALLIEAEGFVDEAGGGESGASFRNDDAEEQ